jgi:hypothetical protein
VVWCLPIAPKDAVKKPLDPADIIAPGQPDEAARERDIAEFDEVCRRMSVRASELAPEDATEEELDRIAVELTRAALRAR